MQQRRPTDEELNLPFDGGLFSPLTNIKRTRYNDAWNFYVSVATLQRQIDAARETDKRLSYYRFQSYDEKQKFVLGMELHQRAYPDIDWCSEFNVV
jgi:hypothetical protein